MVVALAVQLWFFAHVLWWRSFQPEQSAFMAARIAQLRAKDPKAKLAHQWVPYERISSQLKRAVVAAEDAKFIDHEGFDWEAISKAIEKNEQQGQGGRRAPPPSASSWRRTCSSRASAPGCARARRR